MDNTAMNVLPQSTGGFRTVGTTDLPAEGSLFYRDRRQDKTGVGRGLARALSIWCFVPVMILVRCARKKGMLPCNSQPATTVVQL